MIFDVSQKLFEAARDNFPTIVGLLNTAYAGITEYDAEVTNPVKYEKGIRSDILNRGASQFPLVCVGVYSSTPKTEFEQKGAPTRRTEYNFVVQVWLTDTDEGRLYEAATIWEDGLRYFVKNHCQSLVPNLKVPAEADVDISNSEADGSGQYFCIVQAGGVLSK
jgi:hypothetical protein